MTSPPLTPDPTATDPLARARRRARDGWFFVVLSLLALGSGIGAERWLHGAREEGAIAAFIGLISAVVFFGFAAVKLTQAWRGGLTTLGLGTAGFAAFICVLAVLGHLLTRWLIPVSWSVTDLAASTVSLLILGVPLFRAYINPKTEPLERSACAVVASVLSLIYFWALMAVTQKRWLLFGISGMRWQGPSVWPTPGMLPIVTLATTFTALFFLVRGINEYRAATRKMVHPSARRSVWIPFAAWLSVAMMLTLFVSIFSTRTANYWMVAAAILFVVPAVMAGSLLAGFRQRGQVSIRRRVLFTLPLLALAFVLNVVAGVAGSYAGSKHDVASMYHQDFTGDWIWHAPEFLRAPLASTVAGMNNESERWAYGSGMLATTELRREALTAKTRTSPLLVWKAWCQRDPQAALAAALELPATPGATLPGTNHDAGAGNVVGLLGSDADVRARLSSGYSREFIEGLLMGLKTERLKALGPDLVAHFKTQPFNQQTWGQFTIQFPVAADEIAVATLSAPVPDYAAIAIVCQYSTNDQIIVAAMNSNDVIVRKIAMNIGNYNGNIPLVRQILLAAKGALPRADADERRVAAQLLIWICAVDRLPDDGFTILPQPTTIAPLTSSEQSRISEICEKAEAWLAKHGKE